MSNYRLMQKMELLFLMPILPLTSASSRLCSSFPRFTIRMSCRPSLFSSATTHFLTGGKQVATL